MASFRFIFIFIFIFIFAFSSSAQPYNDTDTLSRFRRLSDPHGNLLANWTTTNACTSAWQGVKCSRGRVTSLVLPSLDLRGSIDALAQLDQLRLLDLHSNRLNSTILPLTHCSNLKLVYLSANDFSGQIPSEIARLNRLLRLDLSDNNLQGPIPNQIFQLTRLLTLRLHNNLLTGQLPTSSDLLRLKEFNVSNNALFGNLSPELHTKFGDTSFLGNTGLCGSTPFPVCSPTSANNSYSPPTAAMAQQTVASNPATSTTSGERKLQGLGTPAIVAIVVGNLVLLLVLSSFFVAYYCGKHSGENNLSSKGKAEKGRRSCGSYSSEIKKVYATSGGGGDSDGTTASDRSRLVFFENRKQFILEDLLRASAEMLGKGNLGTVYKAVLEDGCVVAVKRLKDANPCPKREFEQYMEVIGRLTYPNIVRLRAYYYAKEEKLLVFDYLPNGSLHSLLHGNRGPGRIPLDWTTRISLVLGAARGLARIHEEYSVSKIPHGNVKSSNVLLDKNGIACISDFGLALLLNPFHATARLGGYMAPEQAQDKRVSQKADVYSFGVLILEMLTGKAPALYPSPAPAQGEQCADLPKWVRSVVRDEWSVQVFDPELLRYKNIEEELVAMLEVGLSCATHHPEERPSMTEIVKMIEGIGAQQSPLGEYLDESRSSLSPSLATTDDALGYPC